MNADWLPLALYGAPLAAILWVYARRRGRTRAAHRAVLAGSKAAGLTEPASLHPVIDPGRCIGSGACVRACPERALGIIDGQARLVDPAACIGHGACAATCPVDAITLVFGTERRGVEIPELKPTFESNVPGIFIAGELGGMGLIRKAVEQGRQAVDGVRRKPRGRAELDLVIVGAGPAGLAASLAAKQHGLRYVALEQEASLGGSILHYPRAKVAMTAPMELPLVGKVNWREISKESLLAFWDDVVRGNRLALHYGEAMQEVRRDGAGFAVRTGKGRYSASNVLLSIGRRGTPRKLDVPGEDLPKVVYRLVDPGQYRGERVLVVGGGDSAIEAALACAREAGTRVTLSYRGEAFNRVKPGNRTALDDWRARGRLDVLMSSNVRRIEPQRVLLDTAGGEKAIDNDAVLVCAGGVLPTALLKDLGVTVHTLYGEAAPPALAAS
jgi:thioredoxin reductase/ferredoxin